MLYVVMCTMLTFWELNVLHQNLNRTTGVILLMSFKKRPVAVDWQLLRLKGGTAKSPASRLSTRQAFSIFGLLHFARARLCIYLRVHTWLARNSIRPYLITYKWHASRQRVRKVTYYYTVRFSLKAHGF